MDQESTSLVPWMTCVLYEYSVINTALACAGPYTRAVLQRQGPTRTREDGCAFRTSMDTTYR